ncbi:hypothetical protein DCAR_0933887 [Daucus carota subsp. sativus]|uniref:Auxin efflux carrier component n=1 Tax=Daucus carota subsp. sativus TaxID=79200 RepID=A0AAF0XUB5_DAUCS|nr:PREDICTED: auxin efflux carrier component 5-like [Daucus carota subsp. sativus]WOH14368.1 hypothetical protein DCAR_0933887 [Daucus carota subsp. sativus]
MIGWSDIYKVLVAMVPLYVPVILGYGSVKWWHMFNPEQCNAINRMNCYFIIPLFIFEFTTHINPFKMNYLFVAGDVIAKCCIGLVLGGWTYFYRGSYEWCITGFSVSALNNSFIVGVPILKAMYGSLGEEIVIQSTVLQLIIWVMILLFMLEVRRARQSFESVSAVEMSGKDLEENSSGVREIDFRVARPSVWIVMKIVLGKLAKNPNCHACAAGLIWALVANRWHFKLPSIVEGSITIMSNAGRGTSMFCMGLFMALNEKIFACGARPTLLTTIARFVVGPLSVGLGCLALGLRGQVLRIATVQAALPPAVLSFIYAKEYGLHADVTSTAVILGTAITLPVVIAYYAIMEWIGV